MHLRRNAALVLVMPMLVACDRILTGPGCDSDLCLLSTRVEGQVTDGPGVPLPAASVSLRPLYLGLGGDSCVGSPLAGEEDRAVLVAAGDLGEFSTILEAPATHRPHCVEVRANPPPGESLGPRTDTVRASWVPPGRAIPVIFVRIALYPS